jgi:hypothetical protein
MARKPPALARELLRNFPKRRARNARRRRKGARAAPGTTGNGAAPEVRVASVQEGGARELPGSAESQ